MVAEELSWVCEMGRVPEAGAGPGERHAGWHEDSGMNVSLTSKGRPAPSPGVLRQRRV